MKIKVSQNYIGEYEAIDDDTYDCDCDQDGFFTTSPVGYGKTEQEAVEDLMEKLPFDVMSTIDPDYAESFER